jgi:electron transport complex protein RnfC
MSLSLLRSFRHGVHPNEHKETAEVPITRMPFVEHYELPLGQHLGAPARPIVRPGDSVRRGQQVAEPGGYVSTSLHSPVTGRVRAVARRRHPFGAQTETIVIEADPFDTQEFSAQGPIDWKSLSREAFVEHVQQAGLVGLGGAAFPSHVKYNPPADKPVQWLVLNGSECEPFLTCDHRVMAERPAAVLQGARILGYMLGVEGIKIGVEQNKASAIEALRTESADDPSIEVLALPVKYPQGAEKMLIKAIFGREVPAGGLPLDIGIVVNNVATMAALADYFACQQPLIERVVTVAGPGIGRAANLLVPLGTPVREVLAQCDLLAETRQVVMGGPMMGQPLPSLDVPVIKGTSGLLAFTDAELEQRQEYNCLRCGKCLDACANFLNPARLARLARARRYDLLEANFALDCMECGGCSYTCPSGIPIAQLVRVAKQVLRERKQAEAKRSTSD